MIANHVLRERGPFGFAEHPPSAMRVRLQCLRQPCGHRHETQPSALGHLRGILRQAVGLCGQIEPKAIPVGRNDGNHLGSFG